MRTYDAFVSLERGPYSSQKLDAGSHDGACGGRVLGSAYLGVSRLAGKSLRMLGHDDRQDRASGDYVKIFSILKLSTMPKVSESLQGYSISGLNALILTPPMQLSDLSPNYRSWSKARWLAYPSNKHCLQRLIATLGRL